MLSRMPVAIGRVSKFLLFPFPLFVLSPLFRIYVQPRDIVFPLFGRSSLSLRPRPVVYCRGHIIQNPYHHGVGCVAESMYYIGEDSSREIGVCYRTFGASNGVGGGIGPG